MTTLYFSFVDCITTDQPFSVNDELEEMCHHLSSDCHLINEADDNYCHHRHGSSSYRDNANTTTTTTPLQCLIWSPSTTDTACQMSISISSSSSSSSLPKTTLRRHRFVAPQNSQKPITITSNHYTFFILFTLYFLALSNSLCEASKSWRHHDAPSSLQPFSAVSISNSQQPGMGPHYLQQSSIPSSSESANYGSYVSSRRPAPPPTAASLQSAYHSYLGSHILSVPFSPNQQLLYQHQMLPHHSTFSIAPTASIASSISVPKPHHNIVQKSIPTGGRNVKMAHPSSSDHHHHQQQQYDVNHQHMLETNSLRGKGTKWWDPRALESGINSQHPAQRHQPQSHQKHAHPSEHHFLNTEDRHANAVLTTKKVIGGNILLPKLRKKQRRIARENPGLIKAITSAMRLSIAECQNQLKDHRWNCPVSDWKKGKNVFGKIIHTGCRETAFVYALNSAAVAHSIARACSEGIIETCTCDNTPQKDQKHGDADWLWGGCSDNIKFGYKYAKQFLDASEKGRDQRFIMNLHNNEAGRLHVSNQMTRECKCHGMSGSCTVKTCWMRLPTFREIGDNLKERFDKASRVRVNNDFRGISGNKYKYKKSMPLETYEKGYPSPTSTDLIFFEESPDFCVANPKYGLMGTEGRQCNASSISVDSCNLVCCDRGYTTEEIEVTERCNCTFRWCCEVNCSICKVKRKIHKCK